MYCVILKNIQLKKRLKSQQIFTFMEYHFIEINVKKKKLNLIKVSNLYTFEDITIT